MLMNRFNMILSYSFNMKKNTFSLVRLVVLGLSVTLTSCTQQRADSNDNSNNNSDNNNDAAIYFQEADVLSIANPGTVPVFNGSRTSTFLELNNYTDKTISNIQYSIDDHNHADLNPDSHTTISNGSSACSVLLPHSSCRIDYTGPLLSAGKIDATSDHFIVNYQIAEQSKTATAVISYKLVYNDTSAKASYISSIGSPTFMSGTNGKRSAMLYYYVNGKNAVSLKDAGFKAASFNIDDKNFTNDSSVTPGMVLSYEVSARYHHAKVKEAYAADMNIASFNLSYFDDNQVLQSTMTSVVNTAQYISGGYIVVPPIATIASKAGNSTTFTIYNVGNQAESVNLSASSDAFSLSANTLTIAANSAQIITLSIKNIGITDTNANVTVVANSNSVTQQFTIVGGSSLLVVGPPSNIILNYAVPQTFTITVTNSSSSNGIFRLSNTAPIVINSNNPNVSAQLTGGTCNAGESLAIGQSCNYNLTLSDSVATDTFNLPYYITTSINYSTSQNNYTDSVIAYSRIVATTIMNSANILPSSLPALTILGNNVDQESQLITFTNNSTLATGSISNITLSGNPTYMTLTTNGVSNPCPVGAGQTISLAPLQSCHMLLKYGPTSSTSTITGSALLNYSYVDYAPFGTQVGYESINYSVTPESVSFIISAVNMNNTSGSSGNGSQANPYQLSGITNGQAITVTYKNVSTESVMVEGFSANYGTAGAFGTYWTVADSCSNVSLSPNATCNIVYMQNFYQTSARNNYNCSGTNQNMNITSPTVTIMALASRNVYQLANLTYPNSLGTTQYVNLSNIYILNSLTAVNTGSSSSLPNYNIYTSIMSHSIANSAGYSVINLRSHLLSNAGFGGEASHAIDISTAGFGSCNATGPIGGSYSQQCVLSSSALSSGNLAESYAFYAQPYLMTNSWYYYQNVSLSGSSTQTYCMQNGSNYLQLN